MRARCRIDVRPYAPPRARPLLASSPPTPRGRSDLDPPLRQDLTRLPVDTNPLLARRERRARPSSRLGRLGARRPNRRSRASRVERASRREGRLLRALECPTIGKSRARSLRLPRNATTHEASLSFATLRAHDSRVHRRGRLRVDEPRASPKAGTRDIPGLIAGNGFEVVYQAATFPARRSRVDRSGRVTR